MFIFEIIHLKIPFAYFPIQIIPQCAPLGKPNIKYLQFCRKYPQLSAFAPALRVTLMPCAEYFKKKTIKRRECNVGLHGGRKQCCCKEKKRKTPLPKSTRHKISQYPQDTKPNLHFGLRGMICAAAALFIAFAILLDSAFSVPLRALAEEKAARLAAELLNSAVLEVMGAYSEKHDPSELAKVQRNESGADILFIDAVKINLLAAQITDCAQIRLRELSNASVGVSLGTASGISLFTEKGPRISVGISPAGRIDSGLSAAFSPAGINQTRYSAYLKLTANIRIILASFEKHIAVSHTAALCETVIVGDVPQAYTNVESVDDALNLLPSTGDTE